MSAALPWKRAVAWGLLRSGVLRLRRARAERGRAVLLLYHRVNDHGDPFFPALSRRIFRLQLDYLAAHYRVQPIEEVAAWLRDGAEGPPRAAITIDDGYPDTLEVAAPELERRGLAATLFLSTAPPETGVPLWTDRVRWTVKHARARNVDLPLVGGRRTAETTAERLALLRPLIARMKALPTAALEAAVAELVAALDPIGPPLRNLCWDDVQRMSAGPIRLGAHTHSHYLLSKLDDETLQDEISRSVRLIEERTGQRVRSFAYPNGEAGDYDGRAVAQLRRLGLECAVTARHALARPEHDAFELPRLYTSEPSLALFAARLAGLGRDEAAVRAAS